MAASSEFPCQAQVVAGKRGGGRIGHRCRLWQPAPPDWIVTKPWGTDQTGRMALARSNASTSVRLRRSGVMRHQASSSAHRSVPSSTSSSGADRQPEMLAPHRVAPGRPRRRRAAPTAGPAQSPGIRGKVDVDQTKHSRRGPASAPAPPTAAAGRSSARRLRGVLRAIPRSPSSAACFAAARVPECHIELPRLRPRLIPESTRSTCSQLLAPSATRSAGVPFTRYASNPSTGVRRSGSGRDA